MAGTEARSPQEGLSVHGNDRDHLVSGNSRFGVCLQDFLRIGEVGIGLDTGFLCAHLVGQHDHRRSELGKGICRVKLSGIRRTGHRRRNNHACIGKHRHQGTPRGILFLFGGHPVQFDAGKTVLVHQGLRGFGQGGTGFFARSDSLHDLFVTDSAHVHREANLLFLGKASKLFEVGNVVFVRVRKAGAVFARNKVAVMNVRQEFVTDIFGGKLGILEPVREICSYLKFSCKKQRSGAS